MPANAFAQALEAPINAIHVQFEGARNVSEQNVRAHILLRRGEVYRQPLADQSIRALYNSGNFEFIEVKQAALPDGSVDVTFVILPKYRISAIEYVGLNKVEVDDFQEDLVSGVGLPLSPVQVKRDSVTIFDHLQEKGYTNASVSYDIIRDEATGTGRVIFRIDEGRRFKISDIRFTGNTHVDGDDLEDEMETSEYISVWSWIMGSGRLRQDVFREDLGKLRDYYRNLGYLDIEISESDVQLDYDGDALDITIPVQEGRKYTIGTIEVTGNDLIETAVLLEAMQLRSGAAFTPDSIEAAIEAIKDTYGQYGYLDTFVRVERQPDTATGIIDTTFSIRQGQLFEVENINIQGNTKTKSDVIIRELALAPGDVFDLVRMKASEARLRNTRFFKEVNVSPEETGIEGRRNLRINVTENETGELTFGAGFSSLSEIVAFIEFSQSNFDLFSRRTWFQGGGQKFRVRLSLGTASNAFILSFEEPWLYNRRMAFGFELFRSETDYLSTDYNELRMGLELYLRKRLFELVQGRLSYRLEQVEISDVNDLVADVIKREEGTRSVSKVGFLLSRDSRDAYQWTKRGSRLSYNIEVAGLGGQTNYVNQEARATKYFLLFEKPFDQTLRLHGRAGTIFGFNDRSVPFFDSYFLGGPYTIRGFDFREVGPKDARLNDPVGGNSMALAQIEYTVRLVELLGIAAFYDIGFVNEDKFNWDPSDYNDSWGIGARISVMNAPLNLDFAWPLTSDDVNDEGMQFHFSFGTAF
jgi:outer membrane protein insertion porin family